MRKLRRGCRNIRRTECSKPDHVSNCQYTAGSDPWAQQRSTNQEKIQMPPSIKELVSFCPTTKCSISWQSTEFTRFILPCLSRILANFCITDTLKQVVQNAPSESGNILGIKLGMTSSPVSRFDSRRC